MIRRSLAVLCFLVVAACGTDPAPGEACTGGIACMSATTALFCEGGTFKAIECRGPAGCIAGDTTAACDVTRSRAGEACPKQSEGAGMCDAGNANQLIKCEAGTWKSSACNGCFTQGTQVMCYQ
jgi:hypothetical protein